MIAVVQSCIKDNSKTKFIGIFNKYGIKLSNGIFSNNSKNTCSKKNNIEINIDCII